VRLDIDRQRDFERQFQALAQAGNSPEGVYTSPYPKYEFLHYLTRHKHLVLHGAPEGGIEIFKPLRSGQSGNLITLYATSDELWANFAAVKPNGILVLNGFFWAKDDQGRARKLYDFSFDPARPFTTPWGAGTVYGLPQSAFETWGYDWVSKGQVRPVLQLTLTPDDFPFYPFLRRVTTEPRAERHFVLVSQTAST
jgi:hypothetical protein